MGDMWAHCNSFHCTDSVCVRQAITRVAHLSNFLFRIHGGIEPSICQGVNCILIISKQMTKLVGLTNSERCI